MWERVIAGVIRHGAAAYLPRRKIAAPGRRRTKKYIDAPRHASALKLFHVPSKPLSKAAQRGSRFSAGLSPSSLSLFIKGVSAATVTAVWKSQK